MSNNDRFNKQDTKLKDPNTINSRSVPVSSSRHSERLRTPNSTNLVNDTKNENSLIRYNHLTYLLYAISFFTAGLLWIIPIIMNYARRKEAENTWLETHFDWQIKTFWYSIIFGIIGVLILLVGFGGFGSGFILGNTDLAYGSTAVTLFGALVIVFAILWHIYRIVRGWIALNDNRPIP